MAKRLTREMADRAAEQLAALAFDKKIEKAEIEEKAYGDELIKKYIPSPILALGNEYSPFFPDAGLHINITREDSTGYHSCHIRTNLKNPVTRKYIPIKVDDYKMAKSLYDKSSRLKNEKQRYKENVSDALIQLRSEKRIEEQFPEALPYLNFSNTISLIPQFQNLRDMLKQQ